MAADLAAQVLSVTVETDLDLAGSFSLLLYNADNTLLDSALLDPGKTVEIHLGYGTELSPAFLGEIAAIEPSFPSDGPPTIRVTGYDKSYKMRRGQPAPTEYNFLNDSLIAARIAVMNGLIPVVDPTPGLKPKVIQVESDFAFLKTLAARYHFDVYVEWDRLHFQFPRPKTAAHVLEWGVNLRSFEPRISAAGLAGLQEIRGYNQELAQAITATVVATEFDPADLVERLGDTALDLLTSLARKGIRQQTVDNPLDAMVLARSLLANLLEGLYEGSGSCAGLPSLRAGDYLEIRGVGRRFSGAYRVRKVTHRLSGSGLSTEFSISQRGHSSLLGMLRKKIVEEPSPNEATKFYGVVVGTVENNDELRSVPPEIPTGKVKVSFPGLSDSFTTTWAPVAAAMTGGDMGFYALPEPGDQVLVGFEHGDLSQPYVLGSLWNANALPPASNLDGTNSRRVLKSKAGHTITFDDTPGVGKLTVKDAMGSSIEFDSATGAITISSLGDLTIKALGKLTLEAAAGTTKIEMTATEVNVS
ncbi:type IV secretion protein Rhs [Acrocarpospora corrugata]|uniref:Type IV secretion protein Rhs n=2 Tax=Acrocarpospora corrugata TaxID=35763 RepID=A0A5M3W610_9ACTN|nr:type IV secretion protein Rhs [Acrocarpospora corrugata]